MSALDHDFHSGSLLPWQRYLFQNNSSCRYCNGQFHANVFRPVANAVAPFLAPWVTAGIKIFVNPLYRQKLALTSPTSGGRSVGIVRSRTKATELVLLLLLLLLLLLTASGLLSFAHK
jgi:hypothetical protein